MLHLLGRRVIRSALRERAQMTEHFIYFGIDRISANEEYVKQELKLKFEGILKAKAEEAEALDDSVFKFCVAILSHRHFLRLKRRCEADDVFAKRLIAFVTRSHQTKCRFMLWAMTEHSLYSIPKTYDVESASRAFARVLCPILLFVLVLLGKLAWEKMNESKSEKLLDALLRIDALEKELKEKELKING